MHSLEGQVSQSCKSTKEQLLFCIFGFTQQDQNGLIRPGSPLQGAPLHGVYESCPRCITVSANIYHSDEAGVTELVEAVGTAAGELFRKLSCCSW